MPDTDLTDKRPMLMLIRPDAKAKTALDGEMNKWLPTEKATVTYVGAWLVSQPDPLGTMDDKRGKLIDLVDVNADTPTDVLFVLPSGTEIASTGLIIRKVAKPPEVK